MTICKMDQKEKKNNQGWANEDNYCFVMALQKGQDDGVLLEKKSCGGVGVFWILRQILSHKETAWK